MKPSRLRFWALLAGLGLVGITGALQAQDNSQARIVRLSFVEGTVTVQRPDVQEWAEAPVNTPLEQGFKLATGENSFAEVQFENGSTARLGQLSLLEFTQLGLRADGSKLNRLTLSQGYASFETFVEDRDNYEVDTPNGSLTPQGNALFRVDLDQKLERLEVFQGSVAFSGPLGTWTLAQNQVLELQPGSDTPYNLSQGITTDDWDKWVSEREANATLAPNSPSPRLYSNNVSDLLYGWNDLSNYGMWSSVPGYGYGWIPMVNAGWTPYTQGRWCWYPGYGYTWISSEPWGWLPYHYGEWRFVQGGGWTWFPGNFGVWSPAQVTWYSGPGWIGWVPTGAHPHGLPRHCPLGRACGAAISTEAFQSGAVVDAHPTMPVNPEDGRRIDRPDVRPDQSGLLPGPVVSQPVWIQRPGVRNTRIVNNGRGDTVSPGSTASGAASNNSAAIQRTVISPSPAGATPTSTIVYDPESRRYVNSSVTPGAQSIMPSSEATADNPTAAGHVTPRAPGEPASAGLEPAGANRFNRPVPAAPATRQAPQPVRTITVPRGAFETGGIRRQPAPAQAGPTGGQWIRGGAQAPGTAPAGESGQARGTVTVRGGSAPAHATPPPRQPRN
jgi:hypothetical protein